MKKTMIKGLAILLIVCQLAACPALAAGSVAYGEKNEEIVTMHGGTLTLENAEGGGTLVTVRLPMGEESR